MHLYFYSARISFKVFTYHTYEYVVSMHKSEIKYVFDARQALQCLAMQLRQVLAMRNQTIDCVLGTVRSRLGSLEGLAHR